MDKPISLHLNKSRKVTGMLRGYDQFMNIVLGDAIEDVSATEQNKIGMVVSKAPSCLCFPIFWSLFSALIA